MNIEIFGLDNSPEAAALKTKIFEMVDGEAKRYEEIAKRVFKTVGKRALGEIYEISKCLNLPLESGVYFLRNESTGLLKIGCAKDIQKRVTQIASAFNFVGYDDKLSLEAIHLCFEPHLSISESFFHKEFSKKRVRGEWFDISNEELKEYFMLCDFLGDYIGNTLVSISEYETMNFQGIEKDFSIKTQELLYEKLKDVPGAFGVEKIFMSGVKNKCYKIIRAVERNGVGIKAVQLEEKDPSVEFGEINMVSVGIRYRDSVKEYDFQSLKAEKYNAAKIAELVSGINKKLIKEEEN